MALYPTIADINVAERDADPIRRSSVTGVVLGEIDLRAEFANLCANKGHWIVFRKFDKTQRSKYWDEQTQSAVGGPEWVYVDQLIRVRKSRNSPGSNATRETEAGIRDARTEVYYLPYTVVPTEIDIIIEISPSNGTRPSVYTIVQAKRILRVDPMRDIEGRVEHYQVLVENMTPKGDITLI